MPTPTPEQLARDARFVFEGTVQRAAPCEVPGVAGASAITVRVDDIVQGPDKLGGFVGHDVLLVLGRGEKIAAGERAVFYANGLAFGATLALQSLGHAPVPGMAAMRAARRPSSTLKQHDVRKRVDSADLVVVGKVAAVRLPPEPPRLRAVGSRRAATPTSTALQSSRFSEHDPQWRDAVIDVESVHKGESSPRQVVVRFPASRDVRWFRAPKFNPGDEGVFILHRSPVAKTAAAQRRGRAMATKRAEVFTALDPNDVQPAGLDAIGPLESSAPVRKVVAAKRRASRGPSTKTAAGRQRKRS